jgi:hypothetical protein
MNKNDEAIHVACPIFCDKEQSHETVLETDENRE